MPSESKHQVEIQICIGPKVIIPVLPAIPAYIFGTVGPIESKSEARKRAKDLLKHNPGYKFCIRQVPNAE